MLLPQNLPSSLTLKFAKYFCWGIRIFKVFTHFTLLSLVVYACEQPDHNAVIAPNGRLQQTGYKTPQSKRFKSNHELTPNSFRALDVEQERGRIRPRVNSLGSGKEVKIQQKPIVIKVEKLLVAQAVKKRRAIGASQAFSANIGAVWSLAQVYAQGGTAELEMRWYKGSDQVSVSPFVVAEGLRWREWSKVTIQPHETGAWRVEVFQPSRQKILASYDFAIKAKSELQVGKTKSLVSKSAEKTLRTAKQTSFQSVNTLIKSGTNINKLTKSATEDITSLKIKNFMIAKKIKRRKPLGVSSRFSLKNERLWGYVEASNLDRPQFIWMEWYRGELLRSRLKVKVGVSKRWRTWSWQRLSKLDEGTWSVKVLSLDGELLAQTQFVVVR